MRRFASIGLVLAVLAGACDSAIPPETTAAQVTASAPTTSVPLHTNAPSSSVVPTGAETTVGDPLVFDPVDTGALTSLRPILDRAEAEAVFAFGPDDPAGAEFTLQECRLTWPGRWEYDVAWTPPPDLGLPVSLFIATGIGQDDLGTFNGIFEVTLDAPGAFTIPVDEAPFQAAYPFMGGGEPGVVRSELGSASLAADGRVCDLSIVAPFPLTSDGAGVVPVTVAPLSPRPEHDAATLQGVVERLDPVVDPLVALVGLVAGFPDGVPFDELHVVDDGTPLGIIEVVERGTCLAVSSRYEDGSRLVQSRGCLPSFPEDPLSDLEFEPALVDVSTPAWSIVVAGPAIDRVEAIIVLPVAGAEPLDPAGRDADPTEYYAAAAADAEGEEVARFPFEDGFVSVRRYDYGEEAFGFEASAFFTGGGRGGSQGLWGETWNGCVASIGYDDGFAVMVFADPTWQVSVSSGGIDPVLDATGDYLVAFIPGLRNPARARAVDAAGNAVPCVANPA